MSARDEEIARGLRRRDPAAFAEFFECYAGRLLGYLTRLVRDRALAEDLLQDTMLRVHSGIDRYDERGAFRAWVYRIATHAAFDALRRVRAKPVAPWHPHALHVPDPAAVDPHAPIDRDRDARRLACGLATLTPEHRAVFLLRADQSLPLADISNVLGIPLGTVKSRLHHAIRTLRAFVEQETTEGDAAREDAPEP